MDKRKIRNLEVKSNITNALFQLMNEKAFSEITITEIIQKAQVARASFYRNYHSKEDVLTTLVSDVLADYREQADYDLSDYSSYRNVLNIFRWFHTYRAYVMNMVNAGFSSFILQGLNCFQEEIAGTMPADSIEKYRLYMFSGAIFDTSIMWITNGEVEPAEEVARFFCDQFNS